MLGWNAGRKRGSGKFFPRTDQGFAELGDFASEQLSDLRGSKERQSVKGKRAASRFAQSGKRGCELIHVGLLGCGIGCSIRDRTLGPDFRDDAGTPRLFVADLREVGCVFLERAREERLGLVACACQQQREAVKIVQRFRGEKRHCAGEIPARIGSHKS
jgi:hypothetical protein